MKGEGREETRDKRREDKERGFFFLSRFNDKKASAWFSERREEEK